MVVVGHLKVISKMSKKSNQKLQQIVDLLKFALSIEDELERLGSGPDALEHDL